MESTSLPDRVQISEPTALLLESVGGFVTERRGLVEAKGKGPMTTYWLMEGRVHHRRRMASNDGRERESDDDGVGTGAS